MEPIQHSKNSDFISALDAQGFAVLNQIYTPEEIQKIISLTENAQTSGANFRRSIDLFAIRQYIKSIPEVGQYIFNKNLLNLIKLFTGKNFFLVKSIYFDKPVNSNWYVAFHQDLTISVDGKSELPGFGHWTVKHEQFAVQPPLSFLENMITIRIHLDGATAKNGALKIIPGSHKFGITQIENFEHLDDLTEVCEVPAGGIMLMKPLLMHASGRTTNQMQRRVIHLEFSNLELPSPLKWAERMDVSTF